MSYSKQLLIMTSSKVFFVGTPAEVEHHVRPVADELDVRIIAPEDVVGAATAGDVAIFFSEHFDRFRQAVTQLKTNNVATLYMIDGILEWRNSWENRADEVASPYAMRPVLSHKVACIGENQAQVLNSWGNAGKTEIVGVPRFDCYVNEDVTPRDVGSVSPQQAKQAKQSKPFRVLVMTAKTPAFTDAQWETVRKSLTDCKSYFDRNADSIEAVWRLTAGLADHIGVKNSMSDLTGGQLRDQLQTVDAVISTPSTAVVESMLAAKPTALLNYFDCPSYLNVAWQIRHSGEFDTVVNSLNNPTAGDCTFNRISCKELYIERRLPLSDLCSWCVLCKRQQRIRLEKRSR